MLILAPMAGATDQAFRRQVKAWGCEFLVSEMVSAKGLVYGSLRTRELLAFTEMERPFAVQLFGSEPQIMAEAARKVVAEYRPDMLDINMGCPTPKIVKNGDGAALLKTPALAAQVAKAVVGAVTVPVTVKIRLGWDDESCNATEVAKRMEDVGVHWVTVHGRTRAQFYSGQADWDAIGKVVEAVSIPVVGNGDVDSPENAAAMLKKTGCAHLMIGRAALGRPWIFREIQSFLRNGHTPAAITPLERYQVIRDHLEDMISLKGEQRAILQMRSHWAWYFKGVAHSAALRRQANQCHSKAAYLELLDDWLSATTGGETSNG